MPHWDQYCISGRKLYEQSLRKSISCAPNVLQCDRYFHPAPSYNVIEPCTTSIVSLVSNLIRSRNLSHRTNFTVTAHLATPFTCALSTVLCQYCITYLHIWNSPSRAPPNSNTQQCLVAKQMTLLRMNTVWSTRTGCRGTSHAKSSAFQSKAVIPPCFHMIHMIPAQRSQEASRPCCSCST